VEDHLRGVAVHALVGWNVLHIGKGRVDRLLRQRHKGVVLFSVEVVGIWHVFKDDPVSHGDTVLLLPVDQVGLDLVRGLNHGVILHLHHVLDSLHLTRLPALEALLEVGVLNLVSPRLNDLDLFEASVLKELVECVRSIVRLEEIPELLDFEGHHESAHLLVPLREWHLIKRLVQFLVSGVPKVSELVLLHRRLLLDVFPLDFLVFPARLCTLYLPCVYRCIQRWPRGFLRRLPELVHHVVEPVSVLEPLEGHALPALHDQGDLSLDLVLEALAIYDYFDVAKVPDLRPYLA